MPYLYRTFAEISVERLQELQRFAEVGRVSAGLIHDMSGPLTAAILHLENEEPHGMPSIKHARRSIRVLERYIEAARKQLRQQANITTFSVKNEIEQAKHILEPLARQRQIRLRFNIECSCTLTGDPAKFQRIIANLVTNAMDAYQANESVSEARPQVRITIMVQQDWLIVRVRDWGKGIPAEQLPWLFEPFYTTKQTTGTFNGLGIGLSTVKQYVEEDFGGEVTVTSSVGKGTEFQVKLPLGHAS